MKLRELKELAKEQNIDISQLDTTHVYFLTLDKYDKDLVTNISKIFQALNIKCIIAPPGIKLYKLEPDNKTAVK